MSSIHVYIDVVQRARPTDCVVDTCKEDLRPQCETRLDLPTLFFCSIKHFLSNTTRNYLTEDVLFLSIIGFLLDYYLYVSDIVHQPTTVAKFRVSIGSVYQETEDFSYTHDNTLQQYFYPQLHDENANIKQIE